MRNVAKQLGVEAMSLYNHVANKEDLVDGLVDIVFGEIEVPAPGEADWKIAMRDACDLGPRGAQPPSLGRRADGGPHEPGAGEHPLPRRG